MVINQKKFSFLDCWYGFGFCDINLSENNIIFWTLKITQKINTKYVKIKIKSSI